MRAWFYLYSFSLSQRRGEKGEETRLFLRLHGPGNLCSTALANDAISELAEYVPKTVIPPYDRTERVAIREATANAAKTRERRGLWIFISDKPFHTYLHPSTS